MAVGKIATEIAKKKAAKELAERLAKEAAERRGTGKVAELQRAADRADQDMLRAAADRKAARDYGQYYGDTKGTNRGTRTNFPTKEAQRRYDTEASARIHEDRVGVINDRGYPRNPPVRADDPTRGRPLTPLSEQFLKTLSPGTRKLLRKREARHNVNQPPTRHPTGPPDTPPPSPPSSPAPKGPDVFPAPPFGPTRFNKQLGEYVPARDHPHYTPPPMKGPDVFPAPPVGGINKAPGSQEKQFADWIQTLKPEQRAELLQTMRDLRPFTPKK